MILPVALHKGKRRAAMNNRGVALVSALMVLMALTIMGAAAIRFATTDIQISGNNKIASQSFNNAEAGVQYAIAQIRGKFARGTLKMTGDPVLLHYSSPGSHYPLLSGGKFPFSNYTTTRLYLKSEIDSTYRFQPTGYSSDSMTSLEVVVKIPTINGVFADGSVKLKNGGNTYNSYDSRITPTPTVLTYKANVGSNTSVELGAATMVNGDLVLGKSITGVQAYDVDPSKGSVYAGGTRGLKVPRMDPDPLGVAGLVTPYQFSNDNLKSSDPTRRISGNTIFGNKTLEPGNYYLTSLNIPGYTLKITGGPVNIYLHGTGTVNVKGAKINMQPDGVTPGFPSNLTIYCDMTDPGLNPGGFDFDLDGKFYGLLYAPNSKINFENNGTVYGMLWGKDIDVKNSFTFYYDQALSTKFSNMVGKVVRWKELY